MQNNMTINNALDSLLDLKGKLRNSRKNLNDVQHLTDLLLNLKIDQGGRTPISDEMLLRVTITLDKHKKIN
tara:strand:- start:1594 stop:1806 length:213 start_codon:yes stop_codon:yes gene_type:complete